MISTVDYLGGAINHSMLVLKKPGDTNSRGIPARIVLDKPTTTLGRNSSASDVFINSQSRPHMISRVHAKIKRNEATGAYTMTSHGMNGVLVNGVKTDRAELKDGDVVVFGGSGMETRVGQRVKEPDSDLVYCFSAVSENDETRWWNVADITGTRVILFVYGKFVVLNA